MFVTVDGIVCRNSAAVCDSWWVVIVSTSFLRALARGLSESLESLNARSSETRSLGTYGLGVCGFRNVRIPCNWGSL